MKQKVEPPREVVMTEADDKVEETKEELKVKKDMEAAAEAGELKRVALQVKQEVGNPNGSGD